MAYALVGWGMVVGCVGARNCAAKVTKVTLKRVRRGAEGSGKVRRNRVFFARRSVDVARGLVPEMRKSR